MGKIAHALATVHDYSTDYLVDGVKVVGRGVKTGALVVKNKTVSAAQSFSNEHSAVEQSRASRRAARKIREKQEAAATEAIQEMADAVVSQVTATPTEAQPKRARNTQQSQKPKHAASR